MSGLQRLNFQKYASGSARPQTYTVTDQAIFEAARNGRFSALVLADEVNVDDRGYATIATSRLRRNNDLQRMMSSKTGRAPVKVIDSEGYTVIRGGVDYLGAAAATRHTMRGVGLFLPPPPFAVGIIAKVPVLGSGNLALFGTNGLTSRLALTFPAGGVVRLYQNYTNSLDNAAGTPNDGAVHFWLMTNDGVTSRVYKDSITSTIISSTKAIPTQDDYLFRIGSLNSGATDADTPSIPGAIDWQAIMIAPVADAATLALMKPKALELRPTLTIT